MRLAPAPHPSTSQRPPAQSPRARRPRATPGVIDIWRADLAGDGGADGGCRGGYGARYGADWDRRGGHRGWKAWEGWEGDRHGLEDLLCAKERARAARLVREDHRVLWTRSRTILRTL